MNELGQGTQAWLLLFHNGHLLKERGGTVKWWRYSLDEIEGMLNVYAILGLTMKYVVIFVIIGFIGNTKKL